MASFPGSPAETAQIDVLVEKGTNESIALQWTSTAPEQLFSVTLEQGNSKNEAQTKETKADSDKKCIVEFTDLKPLTKYAVKITPTGKDNPATTLEVMTRPSLEIPNIEEAQTRCAHLTLTPLPEDEAKHVEGYLLLVKPLEDAKDYPTDGIKDPALQSKLEGLINPPFYLAYEFTQDELTDEETGGQVMIGSGSERKDGKYGALQDPKLTSGGFYRAVFVAIMNLEGKQTVFAEESFQMLIP